MMDVDQLESAVDFAREDFKAKLLLAVRSDATYSIRKLMRVAHVFANHNSSWEYYTSDEIAFDIKGGTLDEILDYDQDVLCPMTPASAASLPDTELCLFAKWWVEHGMPDVFVIWRNKD